MNRGTLLQILRDSVVMPAEPCPCGSPLPTIRVEGRTEDVLHAPQPDGEMVVLLPMALGPLPVEIIVHLDAGYGSGKTRHTLTERGVVGTLERSVGTAR
jgi:hypothetical protein